MLNSRSLSFVNNDALQPPPLTPSHFLVRKRLVIQSPKTLSLIFQADSMSREIQAKNVDQL